MDDSSKISWIFGFNAMANWEITPINERKYDIFGNCINGSRPISPKHKAYQDPFKEFEKVFGEKFQLNSEKRNKDATL